MPLQINELTPYLSVILLKINDQSFDINQLNTCLAPLSNGFQTQIHNTNGVIYYSHYTETKKVNWTTRITIEDTTNHILIVYKFHDYLAIYHSDNSKKNKIYKFMFRHTLNHEFRKLKLIRKEVLNTAFLNGVKIKNLWLNNIDKSSEIKADSKMLSGINLKEALDPIGDQTYSFSAIKVENNDFSIGVNSSDSKIWIKKFSNGVEYFDMIESLLDSVKTSDLMTQGLIYHPVPILANSHINYNLLENMIDVQLMSIESFSPDDYEYEILNPIAHLWDNFKFNFSLQNNVQKIDVFDNTNTQIASFGLTYSINSEIIILHIIADASYNNFDDIQNVLENKNTTKFWFENNYMLTKGVIYKQNYRDVYFNAFKWFDFNNFDVTKEKPTNNAFNLIGQPREDSLFSWVKKYWKGCKNDLIDLNQQYVTGWLICDDGAGEKADFIHVSDENIPTISLIHVKGAKSDSRRIAVTPYEIVVSQSIKNLRYLERDIIIETIENANVNVSNLVWFNGNLNTRTNFRNYIENLPQYNKRIVVLQPHVSENIYTNPITDSAKIQKNLLNALLVSAQNTVQSLGAEFVVIGAQ